MKRAIVQRQRELLATTMVTAVLFASAFVSVLASSPASALPPTLHETTTVACNNTFNGTKFPLQYIVDSTPSANPVAPGASFTVDFHVTAIAAASFLNGVYAAVTAVALPILPDQATITPLANATGPDVVAAIPSTVTIPAPASIPVTSDVLIDLGTVTGTYTAGAAPGPATFALKGDAFAPSRSVTNGVTTNGSPSITSATMQFGAPDIGHAVTGPGIPVGATIVSITSTTTAVLSANATATASFVALTLVGDTLPSGFTEPGWTQVGSTKTLTTSGKQTYETTSLSGGLIKATVLCMGGTWSSTPSTPLLPRTVTDGVTTTASTTITSATAAFSASDVGGGVTGPGIPNFTTIASVTDSTHAVLKAAATATATGVSLVISPAATYGAPLNAPVPFGAVAISAPATTTTTAPATTTTW